MIHTYAIYMKNGIRYEMGAHNKKNVLAELAFCADEVASVQRIYKSGKMAECPW